MLSFYADVRSMIAKGAIGGFLVSCAITSAFAATYDFEELTKPQEVPRSNFWVPPGGDTQSSASAPIVAATRALYENDFARAEKLARELTETAPGRGEGWYILGMALANFNRFDAAMEALDEASKRFDKNGQPLVVKADILRSLGRIDEAEAAYSAATEKDEGLWYAHEQLGRIAQGRGEIGQAADHLLTAARRGAEDQLGIRMDAARLALQSGQNDTAVLAMAELAKAQPENLKAMAGLGHVLMRADRTEDAASIFKALAESDPDEPSATLLWARALLASRQIADAENILNSATTRMPRETSLYAELGRVRGALRDYAGAVTAYDEGLSLAPDDPVLLKGASLVHYRTGELDTALAHANRLVSIRPDNATDRLWLATVHDAREDTTAAITAYEQAITLSPNNWVAKNNLAALLTDEAPDRAVVLASEAYEASGNRDEVKDTLGWAKFASGDLETALEIFTELQQARPDDGKTLLRLGQIQAKRGNSEAARAHLQNAAKLDPGLAETVQDLLDQL